MMTVCFIQTYVFTAVYRPSFMLVMAAMIQNKILILENNMATVLTFQKPLRPRAA